MKLKRWIALFLSALMLLSLLPGSALAVSNGDTKITGNCPSEDAKYRNNGQHFYFAEVDEPWCLKDGTCWWQCVYCGDTYSEYLPALGHDFRDDWITQYEATCTSDGLQIRFCHRCQQEETRVIPALGHSWVTNIISQKEPTCLEDGWKEYTRYCSRCGMSDGASPVVGTAPVIREVYPALGHDFGPWESNPVPTCTESGKDYHTCRRCGYTEFQATAPLGHLWDDGVITRYPTPEQPGEMKFTCQRDPSHTYYEEIPYTGGPTVSPTTPAVTLTVTQISPVKPAYALGETVYFDVMLLNTGSAMLYEPSIVRTNTYTHMNEEVFNSSAGMPFPAGDYYPASSSYTITQDDVDRGSVLLSWWGGAWMMYSETEGYDGYIDAEPQYKELITTQEPLETDGLPVDLTLTMTLASPPKSVYHLNDLVDYLLTLTNTGEADLLYPFLNYTYYDDGIQHIYYVEYDVLGVDTLSPGASVSTVVTVPITQTAIENGQQSVSSQGCATLPENAAPTEAQMANYVTTGGQRLWLYSNQCVDSLPTEEGQEEYALQLTAEKTGAVKPVYHQDESVSCAFTLTNISDHDVYLPKVTLTWVEDPSVTWVFNDFVVLTPGESYTGSDADSINSVDVANGQFSIEFTGEATVPGTEEKVYSNSVTLVWPTEEEPPVPPEGEYSISLSVVGDPTDVIYYVDSAGDTDPFTFYLTVTNTGTLPLVLGQSVIQFASKAILPSEPPQLLLPLQSYTFCVNNVVLNETDIAPGTATEGTLGTVTLFFQATGCDPDTGKQVCSSNEPSLTYTLAEFKPWTPEDANIFVTKAETSTPPSNPNGYLLGETIYYDITVTNIGDVTVTNLEVYDNNYDKGPIATIGELAPGESIVISFEYEVQPIDVENLQVVNIARVDWTDPITDLPRSNFSNYVFSDVTKLPPEGGLEIVKALYGGPDNGSYYIPGEEIYYTITVTNTMDTPLNFVEIYDSLAETGMIANFGTFAPHDSITMPFSYTATDFDADVKGYVDNIAWGWGFTPDNTEIDGTSNMVIVPVAREPLKNSALSITKTEFSHPKNGVYYQLDEIIEYTITVENIGETVLYDVALFDSLDDWIKGEFAHIGILKPGEKQSFPYKHKVTQGDVDWTYVENWACADFWAEGDSSTIYTVYAGPVISPTSEKIIPPPPEKSKGDGDSCILTLKGLGAYTIDAEQHFCAAHRKCFDQMNDLVSKAAGPDELKAAWQEAASIWRAALEDEYVSVLNTADGKAKMAIAEEKAAFSKYLESFEALLASVSPDDAAKASKNLCEVMMRQCSELCYLAHNPGKMRPDSMMNPSVKAIEGDQAAQKCAVAIAPSRTGEARLYAQLCEEHGATLKAVGNLAHSAVSRTGEEDAFRRARRLWQANLDAATNLQYKAADKDLRKVIGQNRMLFDQLLEKRAVMLETLYPNNPEIAAEVLSNAMRDQLLTFCAIW